MLKKNTPWSLTLDWWFSHISSLAIDLTDETLSLDWTADYLIMSSYSPDTSFPLFSFTSSLCLFLLLFFLCRMTPPPLWSFPEWLWLDSLLSDCPLVWGVLALFWLFWESGLEGQSLSLFLSKVSTMPLTAAADVTEDLEKRRSASLNFLFRLSALLFVVLENRFVLAKYLSHPLMMFP